MSSSKYCGDYSRCEIDILQYLDMPSWKYWKIPDAYEETQLNHCMKYVSHVYKKYISYLI